MLESERKSNFPRIALGKTRPVAWLECEKLKECNPLDFLKAKSKWDPCGSLSAGKGSSSQVLLELSSLWTPQNLWWPPQSSPQTIPLWNKRVMVYMTFNRLSLPPFHPFCSFMTQRSGIESHHAYTMCLLHTDGWTPLSRSHIWKGSGWIDPKSHSCDGARERLFLRPAISHRSAFIASLRKVGPSRVIYVCWQFPKVIAVFSLGLYSCPECSAQSQGKTMSGTIRGSILTIVTPQCSSQQRKHKATTQMLPLLSFISCCWDKRPQQKDLKGERAHLAHSSRL